jgi:hypothetical protein
MRLRIAQPFQDQQPLLAGQCLDQLHVQRRVVSRHLAIMATS